MHSRSRFAIAAVAISAELLMVSWPVHALTFPDVPDGNPYKEEIDQLSDRGIIRGNPDKTFNPAGTVNRAELLTMLYRAAGKNAAAPASACFTDVPAGAWFAAVVCDSAKNGYVGGYGDKTFRPGNAVNRVEALKMIHTVLGIAVDGDASMDPLKTYGDVSLTAWYAPYMASAFARGILPVAGQSITSFTPDASLTRGEAAAYLFNALGLTRRSSSSSGIASSAGSRSSRSSAASSDGSVTLRNLDFPFEDDGRMEKGTSRVYTFSLSRSVVGSFTATAGAGGAIQCRLYKLEKETSFSLEYYIGHRAGNVCSMRVALSPGAYQFEMSAVGGAADFRLLTTSATGDGNDGFRQAIPLDDAAKTGYLQPTDFGEWYTFTVPRQKNMTLTLSNSDHLKCLIYPMGDVDLFGFSGPVCNEAYEFPPGTYVVGIMLRDGESDRQSFTVQVR